MAWAVLAQLPQYQAWDAAGAWWLRVGLNSAWGLAFLVLAWGLWRRRCWAWRGLPWVIIPYGLLSFLWFAVYAQAAYDRARIPSVGVTSMLGVGLTLWLRTRLHRVLCGVEINDNTRVEEKFPGCAERDA